MSRFQNIKYFDTQSLSASVNGSAIDIQGCNHVSFIADVSASSSPVGTLKIQLSNDQNTWVDSSSTYSVTGDIATRLAQSNIGDRYCRLVYVRTSGTATLNASVSAK